MIIEKSYFFSELVQPLPGHWIPVTAQRSEAGLIIGYLSRRIRQLAGEDGLVIGYSVFLDS